MKLLAPLPLLLLCACQTTQVSSSAPIPQVPADYRQRVADRLADGYAADAKGAAEITSEVTAREIGRTVTAQFKVRYPVMISGTGGLGSYAAGSLDRTTVGMRCITVEVDSVGYKTKHRLGDELACGVREAWSPFPELDAVGERVRACAGPHDRRCYDAAGKPRPALFRSGMPRARPGVLTPPAGTPAASS